MGIFAGRVNREEDDKKKALEAPFSNGDVGVG